jgi:hypothetical protein
MSGTKFVEIAQGVGIAVYKRAAFIVLILVVFQFIQLTNLQSSIDTQRLDQDAKAQKSLAKALEENQKEHKKTQRYIRCIVLLPEIERTDENFAKCGETGEVEPSSGLTESGQVFQPPAAAAPAPLVDTTQPSVNYPTTSAPPEPERTGTQGRFGPAIQTILDDLPGSIYKP